MAPGGVGWRLLDVVVRQTPPLIEFGWELRPSRWMNCFANSRSSAESRYCVYKALAQLWGGAGTRV